MGLLRMRPVGIAIAIAGLTLLTACGGSSGAGGTPPFVHTKDHIRHAG